MTEHQLLKGQTILSEIEHLKSAMLTIQKSDFFKDRNCCTGSRYGNGDADEFLAQIEVTYKKAMIEEIKMRVDALEEDFKSL